MKLDVSKAIQAPGEEISFSVSGDIPPAEWNGEQLRFVSPAEVCGTYVAVKDTVWVRASVQVDMQLACANCLGETIHHGAASFEACFDRHPDPEDPDLFSFEGHTLVLDDAALGALWLEMPMRILCHPACKGLCPACGANRNETACACQKEAQKHPFSALATLLNQDEEVE